MGNEMGNNNTSGLREEDSVTQDKSSRQEIASVDDYKGQNQVVPAAEDNDSQGKETGFASDVVGREDHNVDDKKIYNKELNEDNMKTEGKESLQEAARTDDVKGQSHEVPIHDDIHKNEKETGLASTNPEGVAETHDDNQKQDEKEEYSNMIPDAKERSLQEAAHTNEAKGKDETELISTEPDQIGIASPHIDNGAQDEKGTENNSTNIEVKEKSLQEAASQVEANLVTASADENAHGTETGLVSNETGEASYDSLHNQKEDEKEEDIKKNDKAKEKSSEEAASTDDVERQDHLVPAIEHKSVRGNETGLVSSNPEGTGDPHLDNPKRDNKEEDKTNAVTWNQSPTKDAHADDIEEKSLIVPAAEGEDCNKMEAEAELASGNSMVVGDTLDDNQTLQGQQDDGARNSIPDSASHYLIPQEQAVLAPEQLAKIDTEHLVQENGFISDSRITTDMVESAFVDPSPVVEEEKVYVSVEEMAAKEVSNEEKSELNYGDEDGNNLKKIITMTDLPNGVGARCNGELPGKMMMNSNKNEPADSEVEAILSDETQNFPFEVNKTEDGGIGLSHKATLVKEESENEDSKQSNCQIHSVEESVEQSYGKGSEDGSKTYEPNASPPEFIMNGQERLETRSLLDPSCDSKSSKNCQFEGAKIVENGHHVDASFNYQKEATEEQQKEVHLVIDPAVISEENFLTDQKYKEESEEKEIIKETVKKIEDLNPTSRRESGEQSMSHSYPIKQAEASVSPCLPLQALPGNQRQENDIQGKMVQVQHSNESKVEMKQESCGEFSPTTSASSFVNKNLTEKNVNSMVELAGEKPLLDLPERPNTTSMPIAQTKLPHKQCAIGETPATIANGDHYQQESVGRVSTESNPDNTSTHAQMRKSPSFDLDLRIDARAEESDQTPLLYQDKTTIDSFSSQADVTLGKVTVVNTECNKNSSPYKAMPVEEKVVTLERSDSEKSNSKTPFLGFLKDEEEEEEVAEMLVTPKKQDKHSGTTTATKVSVKEVTSASSKGKEKRKPRTSLFGTCMCCATVIN